MEAKTKEPEKKDVEQKEDRLSDIPLSQFRAMGYEGRLPDAIVDTYKEFRRRKDSIHPGELTPEGIVTVLFLAGILNKDK